MKVNLKIEIFELAVIKVILKNLFNEIEYNEAADCYVIKKDTAIAIPKDFVPYIEEFIKRDIS